MCIRDRFTTGDIRSSIPRFATDALQDNRALIDLLAAIATDLQATPAQVALAWLLAQEPWIVPIPGTRKLHRLEENLAAADLELSPDALARIEDAAAQVTITGARYPDHLEKMTNL